MQVSSIADGARLRVKSILMALTILGLALPAMAAPAQVQHDTVIRNGLIYDGSGKPPYVGDVAIDKDRISYVGPHAPGKGRTEIDAHGKAVSPGFINMLAHPEESLLADGRGLSDLRQGGTLEGMGEDSMGPLTSKMRHLAVQRQSDIHYAVDWTTLGEFLTELERRGIAPNV